MFLKIDKESKFKKFFFFFFFFWGGGGEVGWGGVVGGGVNTMYKCFSSTLQGIQKCQIILKYMLKYRRNGPDKLN